MIASYFLQIKTVMKISSCFKHDIFSTQFSITKIMKLDDFQKILKQNKLQKKGERIFIPKTPKPQNPKTPRR